jgi:predicted CXXCH cytochrome family protein
MVVPKDFGKYGHYRAGALDAAAAKPVSYAGQEACAMCHEEQVSARSGGRHAGIACESCHGPLAAHANDPTSLTPKRPDSGVLCVRCHEKDAAKPKAFPQVATAGHFTGEACHTCHKPHNPHL